MHYVTIKPYDIANGPGVRVSLFVSGCRHHCPDCFNAEAWDFDFGEPFTQETIEAILQHLKLPYIQGLTLLGGEPFEPENQPAVLDLVRQVREYCPDKTVWAFSGFTLEQLLSGQTGPVAITQALLSHLDVLVDGPFLSALKDLSLRFRGSSNQRIIDLPATLQTGNIVLWDETQ